MGLGSSLIIACQSGDQTPQTESSSITSDPAALEATALLETCAGDTSLALNGFEQMNPDIFIEAPDMDVVRATLPVEIDLTAMLVRQDIRPPLRKTYCNIGIQTMVVDYDYPVEDDAVASVTRRSLYGWIADERGTGWQINAIGTRQNCARDRSPETGLCL
jgi:hypothetical protein